MSKETLTPAQVTIEIRGMRDERDDWHRVLASVRGQKSGWEQAVANIRRRAGDAFIVGEDTKAEALRLLAAAVVLDADLDALAPLREAVAVGIAQRVDAAAVFLLVELFSFGDLVHPLGTAFFSPIMCPISYSGVTGSRLYAAGIDLVHVFPA